MRQIAAEIEQDPEALADTPREAPIRRADEVAAARTPIVVWEE